MSVNIKSQQGTTVAELVIATAVIGLLIVPALMVMIYFYGGTLRNNTQARLAVESQNILRTIVEELRTSSGVRGNNTINDPNAPAGGWTTSNENLVLIISTPVLDNSNNFVINSLTGDPYQNEIVYFATDGKLYKRFLANASAPNNRFKTSCPANLATATCPEDVLLSSNFKDMSFVFYDQDDAETTTLTNARSILMTIQMERQMFGQIVDFENKIRITLRNSLS